MGSEMCIRDRIIWSLIYIQNILHFCYEFSISLGFGIEGTATGAYGIPLQQVARSVVYEGNISNEEKSFLNEIMPLEKYIDNYRPGLVDHMKWSEDFNTEFLRNIRRSF